MRKLELDELKEIRKVLRHEVYQSQENQFLHRLHSVVLVGEGNSCNQVARWFGDNPRTVERWVFKAKDKGAEGLKDMVKSGRPSKLNATSIARLRKDIALPPWELGYKKRRWDGKLLADHIQKLFDCKISVRQSQRILGKLMREMKLDK